MDKTPDVAQLSYCCGKQLVWTSTEDEHGEVDGWGGWCPGCGTEWGVLSTPARLLLPTEQMLLARIAALEEAQRWRVTAEEMPPVGVEVLARFANKPHVYIWQPSGHERLVNPVFWLPIPGVPDGR